MSDFGGGPRVGVAVVGLGYWGPNLVRVLYEIDGFDLRAVCDLDEAALAKVRRRYPDVRATASYESVLSDRSIAAVVIATPISTHHRLAVAALAAGKHVFVEKPLASSASEADDLLSRAATAGVTLMPGHTFLYSPPVNMVRDLIASGELGDIYFISTSRVNLGLHQPDVSVVWDLGPHDFSILRYWLGETPTHLSALSRGCVIPTIPDVAFVSLEFLSGTVVHVELSWLAPSKLRRTTIVGSDKMVVYDDASNEPVRVFDSGVSLPDPESFGEYRLTYRTGDIVSPRVSAAEPLLLELEDFLASIRGGSIARSSAALGVDVVKIIEAVDRSLADDGARVGVEGAANTAA